MAMQVGEKKGGLVAEINVTPMADVMIVLLIIFMVVTPLLQKGVDVRLPQAAKTEDKKEQPKNITVAIKNDRDRTTYLQSGAGTEMYTTTDQKEKAFPAKLQELLRDLPEDAKIVYLKADRELPYSDVMEVMDRCRQAGVEEIALIADRKVKG
jgi:biopolymer transport protein ExbD